MLSPTEPAHRGVEVRLAQLQLARYSALRSKFFARDCPSIGERHRSRVSATMDVLRRDVHLFNAADVPPLRQRDPVNGAVFLHGAVAEDYVRVAQPPVAQHDAPLRPAVEGSSVTALGALDRQMDKYKLAEGHHPLGKGALAHSLVRRESVLALHPDVDDEGGVLHQPREHRALQRDLLVEALLEVQFVRAQHASDVLHRCFDLAIPAGVIGVRVLLQDLFEVLDRVPGLRECVLEQLEDGRLVVGSQRELGVAEPRDVLHQHIHGVVIGINALLRHDVREVGLALRVVRHEDLQADLGLSSDVFPPDDVPRLVEQQVVKGEDADPLRLSAAAVLLATSAASDARGAP